MKNIYFRVLVMCLRKCKCSSKVKNLPFEETMHGRLTCMNRDNHAQIRSSLRQIFTVSSFDNWEHIQTLNCTIYELLMKLPACESSIEKIMCSHVSFLNIL